MTERTFAMSSTGPIVLGLDLPVGSVQVQVLDNITTAHVQLSTQDESGPAADAIRRARSREDGQTLAVEVPKLPGGVTTMTTRSGSTFQFHGNVIGGNVTGMTIVNGQVISGGNVPTVSPILARVVLPAGSSLAVVSQSADAQTFGFLEQVEFRSTSGDLNLDGARAVSASTTSGDMNIGSITGRITARSVSGDIRTELYSAERGVLETTSGDVTVHATGRSSGRLAATTVSGDIRIHGGRHLDLHTRSVSGDVRA